MSLLPQSSLKRLGDLLAVAEAQHKLLRTALNTVVAVDYGQDGDPNDDANAEYHLEQLALAARDLVDAINALPEADGRPVGWVRDGQDGQQ